MIDLLNKWFFVYYYRGRYKELLSLLTRHQTLAESIDDKAGRGMFYAWLGWSLWHRERFKEAHHYLSTALKIGYLFSAGPKSAGGVGSQNGKPAGIRESEVGMRKSE